MRTGAFGLGVALLLTAPGCSGSGDHRPPMVCTGLPDPAAVGPGDAEGWFPLAPSWRWYYRLARQDLSSPADLRIDVGAPLAVRGFAAVELQQIDPVTGAERDAPALVATSAAGLVHLPGAAPRTGPDRYDLRFPVVVGETWVSECSGMDYGEDLDGDGRQEWIDVRLDGRVLGLEDVTTPAGSFAGAARVRLDLTATLHPTDPRYAPERASAWQESWYARGVGVVRRSTGEAGASAETYELVGWSGPETAGGLAALTRVRTAPPGDPGWPPRWHVVPQRGGAARALIVEIVWNGAALGIVGRFVADGVASEPFDVVTQWTGESPYILPGRFVYQVAPGPDRHLVAFTSGTEVRAARVTAAGVPEDGPSGLLVGHCDAFAGNVAASSVGPDFLVVWSCGGIDPGLWAARVSGAGSVGEPARIESVGPSNAMAAGNGAWHLVVWALQGADGGEVFGVRVGPDGVPLGEPVSLAAGQGTWDWGGQGDLACGPSGCLLVWRALEGNGYGLFAARVVEGLPLDPAGVRLASGALDGWIPLVVPTDDGFTFAWTDDDGVKLVRLSSTLAPSPAGGVPMLPHYVSGNAPLGLAVLLSATEADAWVGYVSGADLYAARWIW